MPRTTALTFVATANPCWDRMQAFEKTTSSEVSNLIETPSSVFVPAMTHGPVMTTRFESSIVQFAPERSLMSTPSTVTPNGMTTVEPSTSSWTGVPSTLKS